MGVTPLVAAPGDTNPSDATDQSVKFRHKQPMLGCVTDYATFAHPFIRGLPVSHLLRLLNNSWKADVLQLDLFIRSFVCLFINFFIHSDVHSVFTVHCTEQVGLLMH